MIDKKIDTGGVILRQEHRIAENDTAGDVHDALMTIGADLVVQTVQGLIEGNVETRVQKSFVQGSELLKPAPKLTRELCHIDWNDSTRNILNLIRGLSPYPAAFTELVKDGKALQLKVFRAAAHEMAGQAGHDGHPVIPGLTGNPGTIHSDGRTFLAVETADGAVDLTDVQLQGKKRMDVKAFLAGFREPQEYKTSAGTSKSEIERNVPTEY